MPQEFKVKNGLIVDQGGANITGSSAISGSLAINASGSNVFTVDGTSGRLFSVDDSLSGSLFSVNTAAGLPVMEAFSDNTVRIGQYGKRALYVSQSLVGIGKEGPLNATLDISGSVSITGSLNAPTITGSLFGTASWANNAVTSSYVLNVISASFASNAGLLNNTASSVFVTTGSNRFIGNQIVTGSLLTSGSNTLIGNTVLTGSLFISGSTIQIGNNTLLGNTLLTGSVTISGSVLATGPLTATSATASFGYVSASFLDITGKQTVRGFTQYLPTSDPVPITVPGGYIFSSGSQGDLYFSQTNGSIQNIIRLRWLEGNMYTGLLNGAVISTLSTTTYQVSSGSGIIVSLNGSLSSDPYPTIQYLTWPNLSASIAPLSASYDQSFISIKQSGSTAFGEIFAQGTPYANGEYNTVITIGNVIHQNRSTINATATYPTVAYGIKQRNNDFIKAFGALKLSGLNTIQSGSTTGSLLVTSGTAYSDGRNYTTDVNNPSYVIDSGSPTSKIFRYYQSGSSWVYLTNGGAGYKTIDPTQYSNNGVLTAVPGTGINREWTIQRVFYFPAGATKGIYVYYGNQTYPTELEAIANIPFENFIEAPNTAAGAILSSYLILRNNADLTNVDSYKIQQGGLFRSVGGSGGGGSPITQTLASLSDVAISGPTNGQPLVYNGTITKWENQSTLTATLVGNASTATTASYAGTASIATSASFASTASYWSGSILNVTSASYAATASLPLRGVITGSVTGATLTFTKGDGTTFDLTVAQSETVSTASYVTSSGVYGPNGSNSILSSSFALTASYVAQSISASFAATAALAPNYVLTSVTSSMLAPYVQNSQTSSFVQNSQTSSMSVASASQAATASYVSASNIAGLSLSQISLGVVTASINSGTNIFNIVSGSNTLVVVDNTGSVGIGITSPGYKLDVNGTARFSGSITINGNVSLTTSTGNFSLQNGASWNPASNESTLYSIGLFKVTTNNGICLRVASDAFGGGSAFPVGSLAIGTSTNLASSLLTLESSTKGFLPPRMTTTQKNAISSPAAGLQVYDTTLSQMSYYNGTTWVNF